jgi:hypothetical protein
MPARWGAPGLWLAALLLLPALAAAASAASPPPDYAFQPAAGPLPLSAGSSATTSITVTSEQGYHAPPVLVTVVSAPPGVEASCAPASIEPPGSCTLTVAAPLDLTPGNYPLRLRASNGTTARDTNLTLYVLAPVYVTLSPDRSTLTLPVNGTATAQFELAIHGIPRGPLNLSLSVRGLPPHVTAALSPTSATSGGTYRVTLSASADASPGNHTLLLNATDGKYSGQAPLNLSVVPAGPPGGAVPPPGSSPGLVLVDQPWVLLALTTALSASAVAATRLAMTSRAHRAGPHRVEDVFLLYRDGRAVFTHIDPTAESASDPEVLGSMIVAVQDFARDSLRKGSHVDQMRYGSRSVLFARGAYTILAVTVEGDPPTDLRERMALAVVAVESRFAHLLSKWDGSRHEFEGIKKALEPLWAQRA